MEHLHGVMPKRPIQAEEFIVNNPTYDGRGVVVAILDTGVDPGAAGLAQTTDGSVKVIEVRDCSGSGDVDMTKTAAATETAGNTVSITGITGKKLTINTDTCKNPSGLWRVGSKAIYDFFPRGLVSRLSSHFKNTYTVAHRKALAAASKALKDFEAKHPGGKLERDVLMQQKELRARVSVLEKNTDGEDSGLVVDCVVFEDENGIWRALVDTKGDGDLTTAPPLASYSVEHQYAKWDSISQLNYCVNIFNQGSVLSLVVDSGAHGTHVASITAAYFPENPELNGVAPGARIVSLKIGDGRLDGMETGQSMIRACVVAAELGVDIINMSFGEPSQYPNSGQVIQAMKELVEKHGVTFVTSAGNAGPALSTCGAPAVAGDFMIGVAAYVDKQMMVPQYQMNNQDFGKEGAYTWSSRGPSYRGNMGVCISAPGGAIASVPEWTLQQKRMMNGTSMASPNACGGISLLMSALKQNGMPSSPWRIKRCIEATARPIEDTEVFAQGAGLLTVTDAFQCLMDTKDLWWMDLPFLVETSGGKAGIYLREPWDLEETSGHIIRVSPRFETDEHDPKVGKNITPWDKSKRNELELKLMLETDADWIKMPPFILQNSTIGFTATIKSGEITKPGVHFSWIYAYSTDSPQVPVWKVPVTVIKPLKLNKNVLVVGDEYVLHGNQNEVGLKNVMFSPGVIKRFFCVVPEGATWMDVRVKTCEDQGVTDVVNDRIFYVHCLQMNDASHYKYDENRTRGIRLKPEPGNFAATSLDVTHGTVEICIAQFWSSLGSGPIDITVCYRGVKLNQTELSLGVWNGFVKKAVVTAKLASTTIKPSGSLKKHQHSISPHTVQTSVMPVPIRDEMFQRPVWQLELKYTINQTEDGKLTARVPNFNTMIYESPVNLCMYYVLDENNSILFTGDARPSSFFAKKGTLTLRLCIRHENPAVLKKLESLRIVVERKLKKSINLSFYSTLSRAAVHSSNLLTTKKISQGGRTALFVSAPKDFAVPAGCTTGDVLCGEITFCQNKSWGSDKKPTPYPITLVVGAMTKADSKTEPGLKEPVAEEASALVKYILPVLKKRVEGLGAISEKDEQVFADQVKETEALIAKYRDKSLQELDDLYRKCLHTKLRWNQKRYSSNQTEAIRNEIVDICQNLANADTLAELEEERSKKFKDIDGLPLTDAEAKRKKRTTELQQSVVNAILTEMLVTSNLEDEKSQKLVEKYAKEHDLGLQQLRMARHEKAERHAMYVEVLTKLLNESNSTLGQLPMPTDKSKLHVMMVEAYKKLGWEHLVKADEMKKRKLFPVGISLF